jgi:hypothetical protein
LGFDFGSSIITGRCNTIDGSNNVILSGCGNVLTGDYQIIGAGDGNTLDYNGQPCALILGGSNNSANLAVIRGSNNVGGISIGGDCNTGNVVSIFGNNNSASLGGYAFASSFNCLSCSVGGIICSSPMIVYGKFNCLSAGSCADGTSFIVGGKCNVLFDNCSVIINGDNNTIRTITSVTNSGFRNTIINGDSNFICAQNRYTSINNAVSSCIGRLSNFARIDGGCANTIYAVSNHANIINGCNNFARGQFTSIVNGASNCIYSFHSSILGGQNNFACCAFSFIAGCGITSVMACALHANQLVLTNVPTASAGLPSGALWSDAGTIKIIP